MEEDKTARGVHFKTYSEKMPSSSAHSDASTVCLEIHSSDQTVLCTAGLLFPVIGGISAMFQYWCRWLSFRLPGRPLVLTVLNHHTTPTHRSESRFEVPNSAVIFIVAVYCYYAPPCSGLLTRRTSIISCKMVYHNTGGPRRNVPYLGRVFLMLKYTDITQNTYVQSCTVTEIMAREKCGLLAGPRTVPVS